MTKNMPIEQELLRYASETPTTRDNKYLPLIDLAKKLNFRKEFNLSKTKCLIIGGGAVRMKYPWYGQSPIMPKLSHLIWLNHQNSQN
jgi:hypothetical protein